MDFLIFTVSNEISCNNGCIYKQLNVSIETIFLQKALQALIIINHIYYDCA